MSVKTFYFYTDLENAFNCRRVQAILNGKLPLTEPWRFNDPFDSQLHFRHEFTEDSAREYLGMDREGPDWCLFFSKKSLLETAEVKRTKEIWSSWAAFSLSEVSDSLLMWAHYGNNHKGICLELEYEAPEETEDFWFEKIRYSSHYPDDIIISYAEGPTDAALRTLLFTKSLEWHYEKEWRLVSKHFIAQNPFARIISSPFRVNRIFCGAKFQRSLVVNNFEKDLEQILSGFSEKTTMYAEVERFNKKALADLRTIESREYLGFFDNEHFPKGNLDLFWRARAVFEIVEREIPIFDYELLEGEFSISPVESRLCAESHNYKERVAPRPWKYRDE